MDTRPPAAPPSRGRPAAALSWALVAALAGWTLAAPACATALALITTRDEVRCYLWRPPLNRVQQVLLAGRSNDCAEQQCWAVVRLGTGRSLTCFYSLPALRGQ